MVSVQVKSQQHARSGARRRVQIRRRDLSACSVSALAVDPCEDPRWSEDAWGFYGELADLERWCPGAFDDENEGDDYEERMHEVRMASGVFA